MHKKINDVYTFDEIPGKVKRQNSLKNVNYAMELKHSFVQVLEFTLKSRLKTLISEHVRHSTCFTISHLPFECLSIVVN